MRSHILWISTAVVTLIATQTVHAQQYNIICPLFTLYQSPQGFVEYCNAYANSCEDIPDGLCWSWDYEPEPCDCPDSSGCHVADSGSSFANVFPPIAEKVTADGLPFGFSKKAAVTKSVAVYLMKDGEPVYFRIFHCVLKVDGKLEHTCTYTVGFEMKSPLTGIAGLTQITAWQPTDDPNAFKLLRGDRAIYLVRASATGTRPMPTPTPAKQPSQFSEQVSVRVPKLLNDHSVKVDPEQPSS
jgi:hypothetical protein